MTTQTKTRYRVTFDRIGRKRDVPPLDVDAADADDLAGQILAAARPHLGSRNVRVFVGLEAGSGFVITGMAHNAGTFTIERVEGR